MSSRCQRLSLQRILASMALLAVALATLTGCQGAPATGRKAQAASITATPSPSTWTVVTDPALGRQAPASFATRYRALLLSNSNMLATQTLQRSDDAGLTWTTLSWPTVAGVTLPADFADQAQTIWSPSAPRTMFLELILMNDALCPSADEIPIPVINGIARATSTTGKLCQLTYITDDAGATWRPLTPPAPLTGSIAGSLNDVSASLTSGSLDAQGSRLYALFTASAQAYAFYSRLAVSDDGGMTWRLVDGPIAAAGQEVTGYVTAPSGQTLFALTQPTQRQPPGADATPTLPPVQFWSSADGGTTWTRSGTPPGARMDGLNASIDPATGMAIAYLLSDSENDVDLHLYASLDGGRTWPHMVDLRTEEVGPPTSPALLAPLPDGGIALFDGSGLQTKSNAGSGDPALSPLSAWRYDLSAVWTLTQPTGISQVTQVETQTTTGGGVQLWLAGYTPSGASNRLEYTTLTH